MSRCIAAITAVTRSASTISGFIVPTIADVEAGYAWAKDAGVEIVHELKHHRDGSVSFYIRDPDGNVIQALYEPTISPQFFK